MQKGDKFIVVCPVCTEYEIGEIVELIGIGRNASTFINKNGLIQSMWSSEYKPLDRITCDDEQDNID